MDKFADFKYGVRDMENRFSHWFKAVKDISGPIRVPKTVVFQTPLEVVQACCMDKPEKDRKTIQQFVDQTVRPKLRECGLDHQLLFVKNSTFSNKFSATGSCLTTSLDLPQAIVNINQGAMMCIMGYDGTDELVVRERILHNSTRTATIYDGLPFRPEFRVFYDFDAKEVIFVANYWEPSYVGSHLHDLTDKIVWEHQAPIIQDIFEARKAEVADLVGTALQSIKGLSGPWSVDIMLDRPEKEGGTFWLIDMAVAEMSAYWEQRPRLPARGCQQGDQR